MGTEVLRPQDCLIDRFRDVPVVYHRRKNLYGNGSGNGKTSNNYRKPAVRTGKMDQRRRSNSPPATTVPRRSSSVNSTSSQSQNQLVMGQVTILKRGDSLDSKMKEQTMALKSNGDGLIVCGTGRLGPDPEMIPKQIRIYPATGNRLPGDTYAGSAFSMSPSPRSLPLPSFFNKKGENPVADSATRDLRRLLRLE